MSDITEEKEEDVKIAVLSDFPVSDQSLISDQSFIDNTTTLFNLASNIPIKSTSPCNPLLKVSLPFDAVYPVRTSTLNNLFFLKTIRSQKQEELNALNTEKPFSIKCDATLNSDIAPTVPDGISLDNKELLLPVLTRKADILQISEQNLTFDQELSKEDPQTLHDIETLAIPQEYANSRGSTSSIIHSSNQINPLEKPLSGTIQDLIIEKAKEHNVDPKLLTEIVKRESNFQPKVCNQKYGCYAGQGLAQLIPSTVRYCEKKLNKEINPFNPEENLDCAGWLLEQPNGVMNWEPYSGPYDYESSND